MWAVRFFVCLLFSFKMFFHVLGFPGFRCDAFDFFENLGEIALVIKTGRKRNIDNAKICIFQQRACVMYLQRVQIIGEGHAHFLFEQCGKI